MKKSRFNEDQTVQILSEADAELVPEAAEHPRRERSREGSGIAAPHGPALRSPPGSSVRVVNLTPIWSTPLEPYVLGERAMFRAPRAPGFMALWSCSVWARVSLALRSRGFAGIGSWYVLNLWGLFSYPMSRRCAIGFLP
jgi:hypothetical protein